MNIDLFGLNAKFGMKFPRVMKISVYDFNKLIFMGIGNKKAIAAFAKPPGVVAVQVIAHKNISFRVMLSALYDRSECSIV